MDKICLIVLYRTASPSEPLPKKDSLSFLSDLRKASVFGIRSECLMDIRYSVSKDNLSFGRPLNLILVEDQLRDCVSVCLQPSTEKLEKISSWGLDTHTHTRTHRHTNRRECETGLSHRRQRMISPGSKRDSYKTLEPKSLSEFFVLIAVATIGLEIFWFYYRLNYHFRSSWDTC